MSNKKSEMGAAMPVAMRFISLGVMITLIQLIAPFQPVELQAQTVEVESTYLDLSEVLLENESRSSAVRLKGAVDSLKRNNARARAIILDAKGAFEKDPTLKNEALLVSANAQAISLAFNTNNEFCQAAEEHVRATEKVLGELAKAKEGFSGQIARRDKEKTDAEAKVLEMEKKLDALTEELGGLLDQDGDLEPQLNAEVEFLDWMYRQGERASRDVEAVKKEAERDLGKIDRFARGLREKNTTLWYTARGGEVVGGHLKKIARWQKEAMQRRELLRRARQLANAIPDGIEKVLPELEYSVHPDSVGPEVEGSLGSGKRKPRGKEILLKRRAAKAASAKETAQKKGSIKQEPAVGGESAKAGVEVEPLSPPAPESDIFNSQDRVSRLPKKGGGNEN